jgi:inactivated superfamily I helicase
VTLDPNIKQRLAFLARVVQRECSHLAATDGRLFMAPFTSERAALLASDEGLAERVEAFVGRFGRLQDTLGDK